MGREVKRVPLDFKWEIGVPYVGYTNPYKSSKCAVCDGTGLSQEAKVLQDLWYGYRPFKPEQRNSTPFSKNHKAIRELAKKNVGSSSLSIGLEAVRLCKIFNSKWCHHVNQTDVNALVKANRLYDFTHTFTKSGWVPKDPVYIPTADEVNIWSMSAIGHDAINSYVCVEAECQRLGHKSVCDQCQGSGEIFDTIQEKEESRRWKRIPPPVGEGYQIWETVSNGSPISPVFATGEELAKYMATTQWGADKGISEEQWLAFIFGPQWAPSFVITTEGVMTGVEASVKKTGDSGKEISI